MIQSYKNNHKTSPLHYKTTFVQNVATYLAQRVHFDSHVVNNIYNAPFYTTCAQKPSEIVPDFSSATQQI